MYWFISWHCLKDKCLLWNEMLYERSKIILQEKYYKNFSTHSEVENNNYLWDNYKVIRIFNYLNNKFNIKEIRIMFQIIVCLNIYSSKGNLKFLNVYHP